MKKTIIILGICIINVFGLAQNKNTISRNLEKVTIDEKTYYIHTVEKGNTVYSICKAYNLNQFELTEENPSIYDTLFIGQKLRIPVIESKNTTINQILDAEKFDYHTVKSGETLYFIHRLYEIEIKDLKDANIGLTSELSPGQIIRIPKKETLENKESSVKTEDTNYFYYEVKKGNTLFSIAKTYNLHYKEISAENNGVEENLKIGQVIRIPKNENNKHLSSNIDVYKSEEESLSQNNTEDFKNARNNDKLLKEKELVLIPDTESVFSDTIILCENTHDEIKKKYSTHTVANGENLFRISKLYQISIDTIIALNPGSDISVKIGQNLILPFIETEIAEDKEISRIEQSYEEPNDYNDNEIIDSIIVQKKDSFIYEDDVFVYHKVEDNQNIKDISNLYGIKHRKLKKFNKESELENITKGQIIQIPKTLITKNYRQEFIKEEIQKYDIDTNHVLDEVEVIKNIEFDFDSINIAILFPFYLNINDTIGQLSDSIRLVIEEQKKEDPKKALELIPEERIYGKSLVFLRTYEGILLAIDSLKKSGINIHVKTFDTQNNPQKIKDMMIRGKLDDCQIIIGPVYSRCLTPILDYSRKRNKTIISPFISNPEILTDYPNLVQLVTPIDQQLDIFVSELTSKNNHNIVLIKDTSSVRSSKIYSTYKNLIDKHLISKHHNDSLLFQEISVDWSDVFNQDKTAQLKEKEKLKNSLCVDTANLIILPSINQSFVTNTIRQLNTIYEYSKGAYNITLCGLPHWEKYDNIELDFLHNMQLLTYSNFNIDYSNPEVVNFVKNYRLNFYEEPDRYSFFGWDMIMSLPLITNQLYFLNDSNSNKYSGLQSWTNLCRSDSLSGYYNKVIFIQQLKYDYSTVDKGVFFNTKKTKISEYKQTLPLQQEAIEE